MSKKDFYFNVAKNGKGVLHLQATNITIATEIMKGFLSNTLTQFHGG